MSRTFDHQHLVDRIHEISGAPGIAIGVYHQGHVVYEDYRGLRDVEANLPVDRDTIFHVASLTKAITAIAVGIMVDRGDLDWITPVEVILPFFKEHQSEKSRLNVTDFLSHRTGTTWGDALYLQSNNNMMLPKSEALHTFQHLPKVAELRSRYLYNNHAYNIPGLIIERLSKQSYGTFLKKNIFDPLGMMRTFTAIPQNSNVAAPYNILSDGTPFRIPFSEASSDTLMFSAVSVRTSMADILRLYGGILEELDVLGSGANSDLVAIPDAQGGDANDAESKALDCTQFPTKQLNVICAPQIVRNTDTIFE
jgi:CubicO group peptidase (beta-lactamase class C family)